MEAVQSPNGHADSDEWDIDEGIARFLGAHPGDETIRLADVRDKAATELTRLGDEIGACLDRLAVRIPPAVQLYSSADGRIVVGSEHAAKDAIEASLNGDTRVLKMFKEVEVLYDILRKAELRGTGRFESQHFNLGLTSLGCIAFFTESAES